jgi:hypothetical protein
LKLFLELLLLRVSACVPKETPARYEPEEAQSLGVSTDTAGATEGEQPGHRAFSPLAAFWMKFVHSATNFQKPRSPR